jgi:ABC-2 type transport system permease protein
LGAVIKRDLLTAARQRKSFVAVMVVLLFEMLGLYFLARAVGPQFRPEGVDYFPFLVVGVATLSFLLAGIDGFASFIHDSQVGGTIEFLMNTATPPFTVVMLSAVSSFGGRILRMIVYVTVGLLLVRLPIIHPNYFGGLLIVGLSVACASSIGVLAAALQVWNQRGNALVWLVASIMWLMSGTMFPTSALPAQLEKLSNWMPFTHSLKGLRLALLQGSGMQQLWAPIFSLFVFAVVLFPLSAYAFSLAIRNARRRGTLSFY